MSPVFNHILSAILITPLAGALVLLCVSGRKTAVIRWLANGFAGLGFLVSLPLWFLYEPLGKTWQFAERGDWFPTIGASYYVGVDGLSLLLILLTTLVGWIAILASWNEIKERVKEFYSCLLLLQAGLLGAFMALDFLMFFLCGLTVLAAAYFIIGIRGSAERYSARTFMIHALAGSIFVLLGILSLYFHYHSASGVYTFDVTQYQILRVPGWDQAMVFGAFFIGFAVIVPIVPFHGWLPDATTNAPDRRRRRGCGGISQARGLQLRSFQPADSARRLSDRGAGNCHGRDHRHPLWRNRGLGTARWEAPRRILEHQSGLARNPRHVRADACRPHGQHGPANHPRDLDGRAAPHCQRRRGGHPPDA